MRTRILILVFLLITSFNAFGKDTLFEKINNKTWFSDEGHAGSSIVFYKTINGFLKAIIQMHGSGVPVIRSFIYDIEIKHDTIFFLNGLNLKTSEKLGDFTYVFDNETGQKKQLRLAFDYPILYSWSDQRKSIDTQIDVRLLSEILIGKNEIYQEEDLIKTFIEK